jgi:PIN domain nuclease of toxin-antitoxin system
MTIVLDSSAVMAVIQNEAGSARVEETLPGALLSAVNFAEVISKLADRGMDSKIAEAAIQSLGIEIVDFSANQARVTGALRPLTRNAGLSLGDRACLALGVESAATILTTDQAWRRVASSISTPIETIR